MRCTCAPSASASADKRGQAASTAATAPRKRTNNASRDGSSVLSCTQQLAFKGSAWPPQRLSKSSACCWPTPASHSVASAGATGKTLSETSSNTPSVPKEPAIRRETS